jgi:SNF2 family DNA or RNA helicase
MISSFQLQKKPTIEKISNRDVYCLDHQIELQRFNAEMRTWTIEIDSNKKSYALVSDSSGAKETVLFVKKYIKSCSCEDYFSNKCGTCIHIAAVERLLNETQIVEFKQQLKDHFETPGEYVTYASEKNEFLSNIALSKLPVWITEYHQGKSSIEKMLENYNNETKKEIYSPSFVSSLKYIAERKSRTFDPRIDGWIADGTINLNPFPNITLFDYQQESVKRLLSSKRAGLILEMGLGKTLCAITSMFLIQSKIKQRDVSALIVCPSSLKKQWEREILRFTGSKSLVINNGKNLDKWLKTRKDTGFTIVNYELVQRHIEKLKDLPSFDVVIYDEVQKIRNKESKVAKAAKKIKSEYLFALSGTIVENSYDDFISIMEMINEAEVRPKWKFVSTYYEYEGERIQQPKDIIALKKKFKNYLIRPDASAAIKLPGLSEQIHTVKMEPVQESIENLNSGMAKKYLAISKQRSLSYSEKIMLNAYLTKARMAANDARLVDKNTNEKSGKFTILEDLISKYIANNEKVVIFSEWHEMLKLIEQDILKPKGLDYVLFHGGIPSTKRGKYIEEFMNNSSKKLFLSTDAGGIGVDGLQLVSNRIIHTEPPWNPARIDQRNGRLNRMLQKKLVEVDYINSENSIEDMVLFAGSQKRAMRKIIMDIGK